MTFSVNLYVTEKWLREPAETINVPGSGDVARPTDGRVYTSNSTREMYWLLGHGYCMLHPAVPQEPIDPALVTPSTINPTVLMHGDGSLTVEANP
jgi:hypothetical protein